jgi:DNA polymerase
MQRWTFEDVPEKFAQLYSYCQDDVLAECGIDAKLPDLSESELAVWRLDQRINERGVLVDLESVDNALYLIEEYKKQLRARCIELTGHQPSQTAKIAAWVREHGVDLENLQADTVRQVLADKSYPALVREVLAIYSVHNSKAVAKFDTLKEMACSDGRLRGLFRYHGAATGRWSSVGVQLQNLSRGFIDDADQAIEAMRARDLDWLRCLYDIDPMKVLSSCVRGMLIAEEGKEFTSLDFSAIEARVTAWLFDEEWKLDAFREFDLGAGIDMYIQSYARSFNVDSESVSKKQRQIGKVQELALGYEGGVQAFVTMAKTYSIDLNDLAKSVLPHIPPDIAEQAQWSWENNVRARGELTHDVFIACEAIKRSWRNAHPHITRGWKQIKEAAELAVQNPGQVFGLENGKVRFRVTGDFLQMKLPSGRFLNYYKPRWVPGRVVEEKNRYGQVVQKEIPGELRYWGIDTQTRQWRELSSYGGRWTENAVQAIARDLLVNGMMNLERVGYRCVMTVHDEVVCENTIGFGTVEEAAQIMCDLPTWANGCPVVAEGWRARRYKK